MSCVIVMSLQLTIAVSALLVSVQAAMQRQSVSDVPRERAMSPEPQHPSQRRVGIYPDTFG